MKNFKYIFFTLLLMVMIAAVSAGDNQTIDGLNITDNLTQASNDAKIQNKTVMLIFSQDDCYYCDLFKENVLCDKEVQNQLNKDYIVVDIDIYKQPQIASKYQVFGTPTVITLYDNGDESFKIEGYVDREAFLDTLKEI